MLESGARAPEFRLQDLRGETRSLRDLIAAGPAVLAFFKTTCPVCQLAFPFLERIHRGQAERVLSLCGISQDDAQTTGEFNQEFGISFPTLLDSEDAEYPASNAYRISHVPSAFLVEPDGTIAWTMEGFDRRALEWLGAKAGVQTFTARDRVPDFKAG